MIESTESLLPKPAKGQVLQVLSVGDATTGLEELVSLLSTLGVETLVEIPVSLRKITPSTYLGKGKVAEIRKEIESTSVQAVIFDYDLSPNQLRNLEKALQVSTLDRSGVILEIFSRHARTKEAKTQVELAKLVYLLPRLAHFWSHFERQRGGIGLKGMGEKQLEVDRRLLKKRMKVLESRLKRIEKEREVQRASRRAVLKVALVGYTNAGKSTLLNSLTKSSVKAENKLFATLDSSVRALDPDMHPPIVAIDTVGFISKIPPSLIASFRSTIEEVFQADLLLHVIDGSSPHARQQMEATREILKELGLEEKDQIQVINKMDQVSNIHIKKIISPGAIQISALREEDMVRLRHFILEHFKKRLESWDVVLPYKEARLEALLHAYGSISNKKYLKSGVFYRVYIDSKWANRLGLKKYRTSQTLKDL